MHGLTEDDARNLLLIRAIELEDRGHALLTREDLLQANAAGLANDGSGARGSDERFLARRASFAAARLATRNPLVGKVLDHSRWPRWLMWAVPLAAVALGLFTHQIGTGKRLNIIAVPLMGMFAWNLVVYLALIGGGLHRTASVFGRADRPTRPGWLARLSAMGRRRLDGQEPLSRALARFVDEWTRASARLGKARGAVILHLGAALFAVGVVAGMYLRGLGIEYRAGWESTFLGAGSVHLLVATLLAPASALTGVPLPDIDRIAAIRWLGRTTGGENATPWIHLYAATAACLIVAPRLLLAAATGLNVLRLRRALPVPGREDFYVRRLLRDARGGTTEIRVTPYAYTPRPEVQRNLADLLQRTLGEATTISFDAPVEYGGEEAWLATASFSPAIDHHLVLFNLASTPEAENHGAFVHGVSRALTAARGGTAAGVILDESGFRQRLGKQDGDRARLETRLGAWRQVLAPLAPLSLDLQADEDGLRQAVGRVEAMLLQSPELAAVRR